MDEAETNAGLDLTTGFRSARTEFYPAVPGHITFELRARRQLTTLH
jgi:hypothetical protein